MKNERHHKELAIFDEINQKIEKAEEEGNTEKLSSLLLEKTEMAAKMIKHKGLRDNLIAEATEMKKEYLSTQTKSINAKQSKRPN